ncbi:hypothetical protein HOK00_08735, partial [bacterium]|nr:hypothetical protein [bacterium]
MAVRIIMKKLKNKIETFINRIIIDSQISMLFSNLTIKDRKDKNIVIFSGIGKMYITPFEILIYHLLRIKGYKLSYLIYNNDIPINELITKEVKDNIGAKKFWRREVNSSIHFLENANVKFEFISFDEHIFKSIKVKCPSKISEVLTFKYDEIDFGGIVKGSLYRYYKSLSFDSDVYQIALDILKVSISNYIEIKNRNEKSKIDLVLMSHGIYTTWESVVNYCEKMKINFVCYDRAKVKNSININKNQNSPNWDFSAAWYRYQDRKLTSLEDGKVSLYLEDRVLQKGDVYSYNFSEKESDIELLKKRLNIPKHRKIITIFTNLIWDAANVSRDIAFKSPFECIIKTIEHYTNNLNVQVVIRTHPAEKVLGTKEQYGKLVKN